MERQLITGIAHDKNEAKIIVTRVPDKPGAVASIFDGAHWSPWPIVPTEKLTTGRGPGPAHFAHGSM